MSKPESTVTTSELPRTRNADKRRLNRDARRYDWARSFDKDEHGRIVAVYSVRQVQRQFPDMPGALSEPGTMKTPAPRQPDVTHPDLVQARLAIGSTERLMRTMAGLAALAAIFMLVMAVVGGVAYRQWQENEQKQTALLTRQNEMLRQAIRQAKAEAAGLSTLQGQKGHTNRVTGAVEADANALNELFGEFEEENLGD